MLEFIAHLRGTAPYSQSRQIERECPEFPNEGKDQYERRTWRVKAHSNEQGHIELPDKSWARRGNIIIPSVVFQRVLIEAASNRKDKIPNKGNKTYIDSFKVGVLVLEDLMLPITASEVEGDWVSCSPKGQRGQTGVWRCFPIIREWEGDVTFTVLDEIVMSQTVRKTSIMEETLRTAGQFGIGRWRPIKSGGRYGRFAVEGIRIKDLNEPATEAHSNIAVN